MSYFLSGQQIRELPAGFCVVGTCGACGGPVLSPQMSSGVGEPTRTCMDCGRTVKTTLFPNFGPILEMNQKQENQCINLS